MARYQNDLMLDAAFDWIRARITMETASNDTSMPTTYSQAHTIGTYRLAKASLTSTQCTLTDYTGSGLGRKMTIAARSGITIDASGVAKYINLAGSTGATVLMYITECTTQQLTTGNTVNFPAWNIILNDASS